MTESGNEAVTDFGCGRVVAARTVWYAGRRWCVSLDRAPPYNAVRYLVQRRRVAEKRRLESTASRPPSRLRRSMPEPHEALREVGSVWESIKYPQIADGCCRHSFNSMVEYDEQPNRPTLSSKGPSRTPMSTQKCPRSQVPRNQRRTETLKGHVTNLSSPPRRRPMSIFLPRETGFLTVNKQRRVRSQT